ncbi:MAG: DUF2269 domain-containing protein [Actinomycetota bacterium]|nr:DUF2269 domain-containing protein [Actinomycetota bacterium]
MRRYELLKTIHVFFAVIWVGGAATTQVLATRLSRANEPVRLAAFAKDVEFVGTRIFTPSSVVVLGAGIWMVAISGWNFTDLWIVLGLIGIAFSATVGAAFLGPESGRIGKLIEAKGPDDAEVTARLRRIFLVSRVELVVLLLIVINMVVRPGT